MTPTPNGLILPGDMARTPGLTIHVPTGYETPTEQMANGGGGHICTVVVDGETGEVCGRVFRPEQERAYREHQRQCVSDHMDQIRAASPRTRVPIMDPNAWDPELEAHMAEVGRRMRKERRLEVKPSERAGFS